MCLLFLRVFGIGFIAARALVEIFETRLEEIELLSATLLRQAFSAPQN
jgi:hypothetical protein